MNILKSKITKVLFLLCLLADKSFAYDYFYAEDYFEDGQFLYEELNNAYTPKVIYEAYVQFPDIIKQGIKEKKIDVNKVYETDGTLLILLAKQGKDPKSFEFLQFIIENGADLNLCSSGKFFSDEKELYYDGALYEAIDNGDKKTALYLINAGASADFVNHYYNTSLMHAIFREQKEIAFEILKNNSISTKALNYCSGNKTALMMAIDNEMYDLAEEIIKHGADVNIETEYGSALYLACGKRNEKFIKLLLDNGAKPNLKNSNKSPLLQVINDINLVKLLVEKGAKVNGKDAPLVYAAGYKDTAVLEYLISKGAKIESKNAYGETPLMSAISYWNVEAILLLEKHNANWKVVNNDGENAVHYMLFGDYCSECDVDENGNLIDEFTTIKGKSFLEYLISKGVDINKKEKEDGWTPLMHLINSYTYNYTSETKIILAEYLLKNGANPNIRGKEGETAIFCAITNPAMIEVLLKYGADPNAKVDGITALEYAKKLLKTYPSDDLTETIAILSALDKNDSSDDSLTDITLTEALLMGNVELSKKLLAELSDINQPDEEGHYPINNAIRSNNPEVLKLVLARKPDLTKVDKGYEYAPLQRAVIARDKEMVKLLIDAGADVNQQNFDSLYHYYDSPLYSAVGNEVLRKEFQPDLELVKMLVEAGADINLKGGWYQETLFMTALNNSSQEVIEYLLSKNPDLFAVDTRGYTVFHYANSERSKLLTKKLEKQLLNKKMTVKENLNVRDAPERYGDKLFTIKEKSSVQIVEIGQMEVIDNICSVWVKVEIQSGAKDTSGKALKPGQTGWCFAGYLE